LAVKEHLVQLGMRPSWFYSVIMRIPNVVILHPLVEGLDVVRRADVVCVINSSAGYEAAALGKPVVYFSQYGQLLHLPHVRPVRGYCDLGEIRRMLDCADPEEARKRAWNGARYFKAVESYCMDFTTLNVFGRNAAPSEKEVAMILDPLLLSLSADPEEKSADRRSASL
jgi:hypothetical protein